MFQPGDLVVYGTTGVCRVETITKPDFAAADDMRKYYLLKPLQQDGVIYTPVEGNQKVPIRPVISAEEAESLIARIPTIQAKVFHGPTLQSLSQHYQSVVRSCDCMGLIELLMSIGAKRRQAESQNRRLGMVDERFLKQAERMLYGEFSVALGIPMEDVERYIANQACATPVPQPQ